MRTTWRSALASLGRAFIDPRAAFSGGGDWPAPAAVLALVLTAAGAACIPRQLALLSEALAATGNNALDAHYAAMRAGLTRVLLADRLVPSPTMLVAAVGLVFLAEPILTVNGNRRRAIRKVAVLGLVPLVVQRVGELAMTWLAPVVRPPTPGGALDLPHRFETGVLLVWRGIGHPPAWLEVLDARVNLITLWSVALWTVGLATLARSRFELWHVAVPLASLAAAGAVTWLCGPTVLRVVLGTP